VTYEMPTTPGQTTITPRNLWVQWSDDGSIQIQAVMQENTMTASGKIIRQEIGTIPTPFDPAEIIHDPALGHVPAGLIIQVTESWIKTKENARDQATGPDAPSEKTK